MLYYLLYCNFRRPTDEHRFAGLLILPTVLGKPPTQGADAPTAPCDPLSLESVLRLIPGVYLGLGLHIFRVLYAKRTHILACFSPIMKDSRVLSLIMKEDSKVLSVIMKEDSRVLSRILAHASRGGVPRDEGEGGDAAGLRRTG